MQIDPTTLARYGSTGVAVMALLLTAYIIRYILTSVVKSMHANTRATDALRESHIKQTNKIVRKLDTSMKKDSEILSFLESLNGKLSKAVAQTMKEKDSGK